MKLLRSIAGWFRQKYSYYSQPKFNFEIVENDPESVPPQKIFIVQEGVQPDSLIFKCPCGCGADIHLNLLKDAKPRWHFKINKRGNISIYPSVRRTKGCQSHFYLSNSRVDWV